MARRSAQNLLDEWVGDMDLYLSPTLPAGRDIEDFASLLGEIN